MCSFVGMQIAGMLHRCNTNLKMKIINDTNTFSNRVNIRERAAVEEWLASDKVIHVMHDFPFVSTFFSLHPCAISLSVFFF